MRRRLRSVAMANTKKEREVARHRRELGKRLASARAAADLSLSEFARRVGVKPPTACGWESGRYSPTIDRVPRIAEVLGVGVSDLFA